MIAARLRRTRQRRLRHRLADVAFLRHGGDDLRRALGRAFRIAVGRELARRLHQPGENRGFRERERFRVMAEIALGGGLDAIGAGAEIDAVEIEFEDLILRIFVLQPQRENRLLNLARDGAFLRQEEILGELLRQGRAALHAAAAGDVAHDGAADADRVDAPMRIEAAILDGDEGFGRIRRQIREPHRRAASVAAIGEKLAIGVHDGDVGRALGHGELIDRRQTRAVIDGEAAAGDGAPKRQREAPIDQRSHQRARPALRLGARPAARRGAAFGAQFAVVVAVVEPRFATPVAARHRDTRLSPPHGPKCLMQRNEGRLRAG